MENAYFIYKKFAENIDLYLVMPLMAPRPNDERVRNARESMLYIENDDRIVSCKRWREMGGGFASNEDFIQFGHCLDLIEVSCDGRILQDKCFMLPCKFFAYDSIDIEVDLEDTTSFDTSGAQMKLWLTMYLEFKFGDFFGTIDRDDYKRLMQRRPQRGDLFLVQVSERSRIDCILELTNGDKGLWHGRLRYPRGHVNIAPNDDIYSVDRTEANNVTAEFRSRIGKITAIGPICR